MFIYLFVFGCSGSSLLCTAFSSCGELGLLIATVRRPLTVVASPAEEHGLQACRLQQLRHAGSVVVARRALERRLSSCGARAQSLHGMWDPPGPGIEPVSLALAGGFSTTAP